MCESMVNDAWFICCCTLLDFSSTFDISSSVGLIIALSEARAITFFLFLCCCEVFRGRFCTKNSTRFRIISCGSLNIFDKSLMFIVDGTAEQLDIFHSCFSSSTVLDEARAQIRVKKLRPDCRDSSIHYVFRE